MADRKKRCQGCGNPFTPKRSDGLYCKPYCRLKAFRKRDGLIAEKAERNLRFILGHVAQGRTSGASVKATLALYLLDGVKVPKDVKDLIQSM